MIQPFVTNHTSPEELYDDFSKAAVTAAKEVKDFRDYFQGDRYIFTHAVRSRKNSEGIIAWRVTDHPDWLDRDDGGQPEEEDDEIVDVEDGLEGGQGEQNVDSIVGAFTRSHPELKLQYNKDTENIKVISPAHSRSNS